MAWPRLSPEQKRKKRNALARTRRKEDPIAHKNRRLVWLYGITLTQVRELEKTQKGKCKICRTEKAKHVDHDHRTGKVRGLLCGPCNQALGLFRENPVYLKRAIGYLEKHNGG